MVENEKVEEFRMEKKRGIHRSTHPRYEWLDQFRGMVIEFLQQIAYSLALRRLIKSVRRYFVVEIFKNFNGLVGKAVQPRGRG